MLATNSNVSAPSAAAKPCCVPGCSNPRKVSRTGKTLTRCEEHQRGAWRAAKHGSDGGPQQAKPKAAKPPKPSKANTTTKPATPAPKKLVLVDYERGMLTRFEGQAQAEIPLHTMRRGEPRPDTLLLLAAQGYTVVESRPPDMLEQAQRLQQRIDRALQHIVRHASESDSFILAEIALMLRGGERAETHRPIDAGTSVPA